MASNYREPNIIFEGWTDKPGTGIIVTGAASGIGAATAILAAQHGLKVAAWDMFVEGVQETIERAGEFGCNIKPIQADLASDEAVDRAMKETLEFCKPKYLANVAGPKMLNTQWNYEEVVGIACGMIHRLCTAFEALDLDEGAAVVNVAAVAGIFEGGGGDPMVRDSKGRYRRLYQESGRRFEGTCSYELRMPGRSNSYPEKPQRSRRRIHAASDFHQPHGTSGTPGGGSKRYPVPARTGIQLCKRTGYRSRRRTDTGKIGGRTEHDCSRKKDSASERHAEAGSIQTDSERNGTRGSSL